MRQKGGGTASGSERGRPPLHLNFKSGPSVAGVKKLSLNSNYFDTSFLRDVLSYKLCNDFQLIGPQTAFAKVFVRTSDSGAAQYLGLYTATEIVDEAWTSDRFGTKGGLLMKPRAPVFAKARDWRTIAERAVPKTTATEAEQARLLAFARLVNNASDETFARELPEYIDLDNYLRFLVVNVALANLDSYLAMAKNYYLYLNPATGKLTWIPWDFDLSFGGFFLCGTPDQRIHLSIDSPATVDDRLVDRVLGIPGVKQRYHMLMRSFIAKHFNVLALEQQIDTLAALIEPAVMQDSRDRSQRFKASLDSRGRNLPGNGWQVDIGLKKFVEGRVASITKQLDGQSKGERPRFGFGR